jgi:hypothetical protein
VVAEALGALGLEQPEVEVAQWKQQPAEGEMGGGAPPAPGQQELNKLECKNEPGGGGAGAPARGDDFEITGEQPQTGGRKAAVVLGIAVVGMAEGHDQMGIAAGREHALDFLNDARGIDDVFEHGIAFDARKDVIGKRQRMRIGLHVDAGRREEIEIDVAGDAAARTADIEVPAAEGEVERLPGIGPEGSGRLEQAAQAFSEGQS